MLKIFTILFATAAALTTSCGDSSARSSLRSYIPGTYAREVRNEFSVGCDTLVITQISEAGNNYRIIHRATFHRVLEEKSSKIERKQEVWNAVYNEQEKLLHETVKGKLLSFNPEGKTLYVGTSEYKKVPK